MSSESNRAGGSSSMRATHARGLNVDALARPGAHLPSVKQPATRAVRVLELQEAATEADDPLPMNTIRQFRAIVIVVGDKGSATGIATATLTCPLPLPPAEAPAEPPTALDTGIETCCTDWTAAAEDEAEEEEEEEAAPPAAAAPAAAEAEEESAAEEAAVRGLSRVLSLYASRCFCQDSSCVSSMLMACSCEMVMAAVNIPKMKHSMSSSTTSTKLQAASSEYRIACARYSSRDSVDSPPSKQRLTLGEVHDVKRNNTSVATNVQQQKV